MQVLQYRTNINCPRCVRSVTGFLNEVEGIGSWEVDTQHPEKILTVRGDKLDPRAVEEAVYEAGFDMEPLK